MATNAQIHANRKNARLSRGPCTSDGKVRASQNAFKHGLNKPASSDPQFAHKIDQIAQFITSQVFIESQQRFSRQIAVLRVEHSRVMHAKLQLYEREVDLFPLPRKLPHTLSTKIFKDLLDELQSPAMTGAIFLQELARLDRYEKQVAAKLKRAIKAFDSAVESSL